MATRCLKNLPDSQTGNRVTYYTADPATHLPSDVLETIEQQVRLVAMGSLIAHKQDVFPA